ncbi:LANO_0D04082g1_1 [Lachancea nothofagi CBS 11611]|uniref:LANO_0D04082g1_1 n=1 Tax=Lachancea nothofagi CBS 11611 TaxID=1266666 RepID=A0A1G4JG10_9SACH|nr:LANO_0D04082g1_1 [Lachancea nothofagi CBS 11611]
MELVVRSGILIEANHTLESQIELQGLSKAPQCLLMFGDKSSFRIEFQHSLELPLIEKSGVTSYRKDTLQKRISLINSIAPDCGLLGVMFLVQQNYDLKRLVAELLQNLPHLYCFFTYAVSVEDLDLKCYQIEEPGAQIPYILSNSDTFLSAIDNARPKSTAQNTEEFEEQEDFKKKLIQRVDIMIRYLENGQITDEILRRINLLVLQLKKTPTEDIDQQVMEKEIELQTLNIICDQWESAQTLKKIPN